MNTLISIASHTIADSITETVLARELHEFLGIGRDYSSWFRDRINSYGFVENEDYIIVQGLSSPKQGSSKARSQKLKNHHITLDMAKELAMVERNEKGREARRYFIGCEKQLKEQAKAIEQPKAAIDQAQTIRTMMVIRNNVVVESHLLNPADMVIRPSELPHLIRHTEFFDTSALPEIMKSVTERILKSC